jgi:hypothetical protein
MHSLQVSVGCVACWHLFTVTGVRPGRKLSGLNRRIPASFTVGHTRRKAQWIAWEYLVPDRELAC